MSANHQTDVRIHLWMCAPQDPKARISPHSFREDWPLAIQPLCCHQGNDGAEFGDIFQRPLTSPSAESCTSYFSINASISILQWSTWTHPWQSGDQQGSLQIRLRSHWGKKGTHLVGRQSGWARKPTSAIVGFSCKRCSRNTGINISLIPYWWNTAHFIWSSSSIHPIISYPNMQTQTPLLDEEPRMEKEHAYRVALRESYDREAEYKGLLFGMQSTVVL